MKHTGERDHAQRRGRTRPGVGATEHCDVELVILVDDL